MKKCELHQDVVIGHSSRIMEIVYKLQTIRIWLSSSLISKYNITQNHYMDIPKNIHDDIMFIVDFRSCLKTLCVQLSHTQLQKCYVRE